MPPAGDEQVLAHWREAGAWWDLEPYREVVRVVDEKGVCRERVAEWPSLGLQEDGGQKPLDENNRDEWNLRERKIRDEKVSAACGSLPTTYYERAYTESHSNGVRKHVNEFRPNLRLAPSQPRGIAQSGYVPLHIWSGYTFGFGTMLAEEIPAFAALAGCPAAAIADRFSLAGAHEFVRSCERQGIRPIVGSTLVLESGGEIVLLATSKHGYEALSQLITVCHMESGRGEPIARWNRLAEYSQGLICLTGGDEGPIDPKLARRDLVGAQQCLEQLIAIYGRENVVLEIDRSYLPWGIRVEALLEELASKYGLLQVAGGRITHARPEHFPTQDMLVCAETLCKVDEIIGKKERAFHNARESNSRPERALNAERFLRTSSEMISFFSERYQLITNSVLLSERFDPLVLPNRTRLPAFSPDDKSELFHLTRSRMNERYPDATRKIRMRIEHELERIARLGFATHFLVAWDMCRWAVGQGIALSGRGSVVDSTVAYCLGLSRIDAIRHNLHFDRFMPEDGSKRPDIDIDFEARRREDVRQYLTMKYGEERVATVAAFGAYCTRGIVREVGKALGLPSEAIGFLSKRIHGGVAPDQILSALEKRPELRESGISKERFRWVFRLAQQMMDIPRNIRAHSSGVVISERPLAETVPLVWGATEVEGRNLKLIQWDKRTAKHYFDKFDILCLRGQDVMSGVERRLSTSNPDFRSESVPIDDPETFRAFRSGELIGVPQSASPAMRQAHVRLRTENLDDASLVQAGIRPGVGGAVKINELIARRRGLKPYSFEHPELEKILGITYGIIVFQEQVDQLLQTFGGYSSGQAEDIRDAIHKRRREDYGQSIREQLLARMRSNGFSDSVAGQVFEMIAGFKGYGFAQGHALAFAELSIRSVYLLQNYPAEYFAALLSAQPAGYYGPCTIANEARSRGVDMLPPCVNASMKEFSVETALAENPTIEVPNGAIRTGLMQVSGLTSEVIERIVATNNGFGTPLAEGSLKQTKLPNFLGSRIESGAAFLPRFSDFFHFCASVRPNRDELEKLVLCGALDSLEPNRRRLLWAIPMAIDFANTVNGLDGRLPLDIPPPPLPEAVVDFSIEEKAAFERTILGMDVEQHLMAFEREHVTARGAITTLDAKRLRDGEKAIVVGNPIRLRFPPTPSGKRVVFFDLEDEAGLLNVTCFDDTYQRDGHAIVCSPYVTLRGHAQDRDGHMAFLATRVFPYRPVMGRAKGQQPPIRTADFLVG